MDLAILPPRVRTGTKKTTEATNERTLLDREKAKVHPTAITTIDRVRGATPVAIQEIMIEDGSNTTTAILVTIIMEIREVPTTTIPARDGEGVLREAITRLIHTTAQHIIFRRQVEATMVTDIHHNMIDITTIMVWLDAIATE